MGLFGFWKKTPIICAQVHEAYEYEEYDLNPIVRMDEEIIHLIDKGVNVVSPFSISHCPNGYFVRIENRFSTYWNPEEYEFGKPMEYAKCFPLESSDKNRGKKIPLEKIVNLTKKNRVEFTKRELNDGIGIIRINQTARKNLRVDLHQIVYVENVRAVFAEKIVVTPLKREHQNIGEEFVKSKLFGRMVFKNFHTTIFWRDTEIPLKIIGVLPVKMALVVTVNEFTDCTVGRSP